MFIGLCSGDLLSLDILRGGIRRVLDPAPLLCYKQELGSLGHLAQANRVL